MRLPWIYLLFVTSMLGIGSAAATEAGPIPAEQTHVQSFSQVTIARLRIQKHLTRVYHQEVDAYLQAKGLSHDPLSPQLLKSELEAVSRISDAVVLTLSLNVEERTEAGREGRGMRRWRVAIRNALAESEHPTKRPLWVRWITTRDGSVWYPYLIFSALGLLSLLSATQAIRRGRRKKVLA